MLGAVDRPPRLWVVAALAWLDDGMLLVQRRPPHARFGAGLLELPGGKIEPGEAPAAALSRELVEEWGPHAAALRVGRVVELLHHVYPAPGPEVILAIYDVDARPWASTWRERVRPEDGSEVIACRTAELPTDEFLPADREFIARVRSAARG